MEGILVTVIGSCFLVVGVSTGAFFCYRIFQATASTAWPFVIGELESTGLKEVVYRGRDVDGSRNFKYNYAVANKKYQGSRVTYSDGINKTLRALRKLQDRYRGKSQILVYYNPKNPSQSVLVPGLHIFNFTPLITSALFILAGIFIQTYDFS